MRLFFTYLYCYFLLLSPNAFSKSWKIVEAPTHQNLARLDMVSSSQGWAISYDGLILKYNGQRWAKTDSLQYLEAKFLPKADSLIAESTELGDLYTICMIDSSNGWIAANHLQSRSYFLLRYNGYEWRVWEHTFPVKFRAVDFLDSGYGIAVGEVGAFQYNENKWQTLPLPISMDYRAVEIVAKDQAFIGGQNGIVLQKNRNSWKILDTSTHDVIRDIDFISPDQGWFVGNNGTILCYKHGALLPEATPSHADLWAVDMLNEKYGFAVGKDGVILQYNGRVWESCPSPTTADLHDIELLDEHEGWIVGAWGTILRLDSTRVNESLKQHYFLFLDQVHQGSQTLIDRIDNVQGVTLADFNDDDLPDIYLTCYQNLNHLLINRGHAFFEDYVIESGTGGNIETRIGRSKYEIGSLAADFDRDGDIDLLLAGKKGTTQFFINTGNAIFRDETLRSNLPSDLNLLDGAIADFNEDGYPDFVVADESRGVRVFINQKYNRFQEQRLDTLKLPTTRIHAVGAADFNNDHHTDILAVHNQTIPVLLLNNGAACYTIHSQHFSPSLVTSFVNSITIADFNNDGYNDLFLCTETGNDAILIYDHAQQMFQNQSEQWEVKQVGRSYSGVAGDFDLDGDVDLFVSRFGADLFYVNIDNSKFREQADKTIYSKAGFLSGYNIGAATADLDNDGDLDLVVGNFEHWSSLLQNNSNTSNYIVLNLIGVNDTHEALGAKVWVTDADTDGLIAFRQINPGNGLFSQNYYSVHVGLGERQQAHVKIRFLNGDEKTYENMSAGAHIHIYQSNQLVRFGYRLCRSALQLLHIPQVPYELFKLIVFMALVIVSAHFIEKRYQWRASHMVIYGLIIIIIYAALTFFSMRPGGFFHHTLPFAMLVTILAVLISVNEQIRKSTSRQQYLQKNIQNASADLSRVNLVEQALSIIVKTLKVIYPYRFFVVYLYHPNGNFFICKKSDSLKVGKALRELVIDYNNVRKFAQLKSPISIEKFSVICKISPPFDLDSLVFPLVKNNTVHGIAIMGLNSDHGNLDPQTLSMIDYLFIQLTVTLNNIRISNEMNDQEKLAAIGSFASGIIHNLKNPVDGLRMIIEMLLHETTPADEKYEYIRELSEGILQLKKTLLQTLDITNNTGEQKAPFSLNEIILEVADYFSKIKKAQVHTQLSDLDAIIDGNKSQLRQALENLIQNGLEASQFSKPVMIRTTLREKDKWILMDIIDRGEGIPLEDLDKIFTLFYSTRESGRGLGLTITQNIIRNHGGYISVKSDKNKGTQFTVGLPIQ